MKKVLILQSRRERSTVLALGVVPLPELVHLPAFHPDTDGFDVAA